MGSLSSLIAGLPSASVSLSPRSVVAAFSFYSCGREMGRGGWEGPQGGALVGVEIDIGGVLVQPEQVRPPA